MTDTLHLVLSALLGSVLGGGVVVKIGISALENHMRTKFQTREEAKGMSHRINAALGGVRDDVDRVERFALALDDRVATVEAKAGLIEERTAQQWQRTNESLDRVARTMERIADAQQQLALQMERLKRGG